MSRIVAFLIALGILLPVPAALAQDKLGTVTFPVSCTAPAQQEFTRGLALYHSFFFLAAVKAFSAAAAADPDCAMAQWGIAMAHWYPLWAPPTEAALKAGTAAVEAATRLGGKTPRERDYIAAIEQFYRRADRLDHSTRAEAYERAMEGVSQAYPSDREAAILYALALQAAANPTDKTYARQLKSAAILEPLFVEQPNHPGVAHYLIHAYDVPALAARALPAARRYAQIAPSVPHALHMPSHTYTLLGLWEESIASNRASEAAARSVGDAGPQFHSIDYQVYAHLQLAQDAEARRALDRLAQIKGSQASMTQMHYAVSASPARLVVERKQWAEAAVLEPVAGPFPYTQAITHFARALGAARLGDVAAARRDLDRLDVLREQMKLPYWATQIDVQRRAAAAWIALAEKRTDEAVKLMRSAADLEGSTDKNPLTPGAIVPARELLGDLLLEVSEPGPALREFETSLKNEPNRYNGLAGAARAAARRGDAEKARDYYRRLVELTASADVERPEMREAKAFLSK
jgi:tetratricopeptide (TPR) repeat protein